MQHEFAITYPLPAPAGDIDSLLGQLQVAGCGDALVGLGLEGQIGLAFIRETDVPSQAELQARAQVEKALRMWHLLR